MIAHRLSTVTGADRIIVVKDGRVADCGTHDELKNRDGLYAKMWEQYNKVCKMEGRVFQMLEKLKNTHLPFLIKVRKIW